jgi:hypothetical protein
VTILVAEARQRGRPFSTTATSTVVIRDVCFTSMGDI